MKQNLTNFFNLIKKDKQAKTLTIIGVLLLFIFTIGYSLSMFTSSKNTTLANVKINDLSFNITTNSGTSDDRVLHLQANKIESFNVIITNLNKIDTKYELIYDVCSDSNCTNILKSLPDGIKVEFMEDNSDELNGLINNAGETKKINLLTTNNTNNDVYIRLNLNAGYEWNELELANQIKDYKNETNIIAYVDGVEVKNYPNTCSYVAKAKAYKNNQEIILNDLKVECDKTTKLWKTSYIGFADKIEINFKHVSFVDDSWSEIAANVKENPTAYAVGSTKQVTIGGQSYTLRVANNTTPDECNGSSFSETACGFVVESVDIIEKRVMNPSGTYKGTQYNYGWNVDGWPASAMRTYLNNEFYNSLPEDLRNVIIDTKVISGHGSMSGETNFTSTDKIYLLSGHEVWEDGTSNKVSTYDTAYNNTRQLDYYKNKGVTTKNYSEARKKPLGSSSYDYWWLRAAYSDNDNYFQRVSNNGDWYYYYANNTYGVSPAFRIG